MDWHRIKAAWRAMSYTRRETTSFHINGKAAEMTDDDKAAMAEAFGHMDRAFAALDKLGRR